MRPRTSRRLRLGIFSMALAVVALAVGAVFASATGPPAPTCVKLWDETLTAKIDSGVPGSASETVTLSDGSVATVTFEWYADKTFTVYVSNAKVASLLVKCGSVDVTWSYSYPGGAGPFSGSGWKPPDGPILAMSHVEICLWPIPPPPPPGELTITKEILGDAPAGGHWTKDQFHVQIFGPDDDGHLAGEGNFSAGGSITFSDLDPGNYLIVEDVHGPYTAVVVGGATVSVSSGGTATKTIENTGPPRCSLTITKEILGEDPPAPMTKDQFHVQIYGPNDDSNLAGEGYFSAGGVLTFSDLLPGSYKIVEDVHGPYAVEIVGGSTVVVAVGAQAAKTINNSYEEPPGSLTITKEILGDDPPVPMSKDQFHVQIFGPDDDSNLAGEGYFSAGGVLSFSDLAPGDYLIVEDEHGPYAVEIVGGSTVTVGSNAQAAKTINNSYEEPPGSLIITKEILGDEPAEPWTKDMFHVIVKGPDGADSVAGSGYFSAAGVLTFSDLAPGEYLIIEDEHGPYTVEIVGGDTVEVTSGGETEVTIENTGPPRGALIITKEILGPEPEDGHWTKDQFHVQIFGPDDDTKLADEGYFSAGGVLIFSGLLPGTYLIVEDEHGPYTVEIVGGDTVEVTSGEEFEVLIENTGPPRGWLRVVKSVGGDDVGLGPEAFTVVVTRIMPDGPPEVIYNDKFPASGILDFYDLFPGWYHVEEEAPGYPWEVTGGGDVELIGGQEGPEIVGIENSASTTVSIVTTEYTTTTKRKTTTTGNSTTSTPTTVKGSTTSVTVKGWIAEVADVQTGGGGTAAAGNALWFVGGFAGILGLGLGATEIAARRRTTA